MKRFVSFILTLCMVVLPMSVVLAENPAKEVLDLSGYSDEDIIAINAQVQAEIFNRHLEKTATLPEGNFTAGRDIPVGTYVLKLLSRDAFSTFTVRAKNAPEDEDPKVYFYFGDDDVGKDYNLTLEEGDIVSVHNCSVSITISMGIVFR